MKRSLRSTVAFRLNLAFTVLSLGFGAIVILGAVSLERINRGVGQVVEGAVPAQKVVAGLQIQLLEISRLAIEHYNSIEPEQLAVFESEYQSALTEFEQSAVRLDARLKNLGGLEDSRIRMEEIIKQSQACLAIFRKICGFTAVPSQPNRTSNQYGRNCGNCSRKSILCLISS